MTLAVLLLVCSPGQDGVLPRDLSEVAKALGCDAVPGFFDRPGLVDPPYLYGVLPGPRERSAVFWCKPKVGSGYLLIEVVDGAMADSIRWQNFPGGLSLAKDSSYDLGNFRHARDRTKSGPRGVTAASRPIVSIYDGAGAMFYRHNGEWFFRMID
jgi:hypothetical protein